jgi:hypothetical protein
LPKVPESELFVVMPPHVAVNLPKEPLRWSVNRAGKEFGLSEETIIRRLALAKERADSVTQTFSTKQLLVAIYGDLSAERLREVRERADNLMLKNAVLRGELLERIEMTKAGEAFMISVKALIETWPVPRKEKDAFLGTLASWPVVVRGVAERQRKQVRLEPAGNGDGETD